jgi:hypothetical protein
LIVCYAILFESVTCQASFSVLLGLGFGLEYLDMTLLDRHIVILKVLDLEKIFQINLNESEFLNKYPTS